MNQKFFFNKYKNRNIAAEFLSFFNKRTILTQLILINLIVFLVTSLTGIIYWLFQITPGGVNSLIWWIAVSADTMQFMKKPWSVLTYMFVHEEFMHFLFNMLWLYWFGIIFKKYISTNKILGTYLVGGLAGVLLFVLAYNTLPVFGSVVQHSIMIGASASITAIVFTVSFFRPNHEISLLLIGKIKLKYIAFIILFFDIIAIGQANTGGHIAHIGGALFGLLYGTSLKNNYDFLAGLHSLFYPTMKKTQSKKNGAYANTDYNYRQQKKDSQERINQILDKISETGYESLTKEEKKTLFDADK